MTVKNPSAKSDIMVVARDEIPAINTVEQDGKIQTLGELRDFQWNSHLKKFFPPNSEFSISWVRLQKDEVLPKHKHPIQTMMIFHRGSGEMLGDSPGPVQEGDVVVVPPGKEHGFVGGPDGLYAFSIQFGAGLYTNPEQPRVMFSHSKLAELKKYNEQCLEKLLQRPFFNLFIDGSLNDSKLLQRYINCMAVWSNVINTPLPIRTEAQYNVQQGFFDPMLESLVHWFAYQILVLDYAEKALIVHWVIEPMAQHYHDLVKAVFSGKMYKHQFDLHFRFADKLIFSEENLRDLSQAEYHRLKEVLILAWSALEAMLDRIFELMKEERHLAV